MTAGGSSTSTIVARTSQQMSECEQPGRWPQPDSQPTPTTRQYCEMLCRVSRDGQCVMPPIPPPTPPPNPKEEVIILPIADVSSSSQPLQPRPESGTEIISVIMPSAPIKPPTIRIPQSARLVNPEANLSRTEMLRRESESKPFFTQSLSGVANRQHRRLVAIVPLFILIVILVFVFAYIAAR